MGDDFHGEAKKVKMLKGERSNYFKPGSFSAINHLEHSPSLCKWFDSLLGQAKKILLKALKAFDHFVAGSYTIWSRAPAFAG